MQKLGPSEHSQYCNHIPPHHLHEFALKGTAYKLRLTFGERTSLFNMRYHCFKIVIQPEQEILPCADRANKECEHFHLKEFTDDLFKAPVFLFRLTSSDCAEIRRPFLANLDSTEQPSVQKLTGEFSRPMDLRYDSKMIQHSTNVESA